jgi:hypothetical protein
MMAPLATWQVRTQVWARWRFLEVEVESEPWGRARRSPSSSGAEAESEPWGRARRSSSSSEGRTLGSGEAELPMSPEAGLSRC